MRNLQLLVMILSALLLSACSSITHRNYDKAKDESLFAFLADDSNLYIVGKLYDYQINKKSIGKSHQYANLWELLKSHSVKGIEVEKIAYDTNSKEAYAIADVDLVDGKSLFDYYIPNIKLVKLENRDKILQEGRLSNIIQTKFMNYSETKEVDWFPVVAPIMMPAYLLRWSIYGKD